MLQVCIISLLRLVLGILGTGAWFKVPLISYIYVVVN